MTVYPFAIDSDSDIIRIDDNITEIGGEAINQLRDAVFAIQKELGIQPSGSLSSTAERINVSLNLDGSIKASAIASIGLVTLPISNSQVGVNAGIEEFKLSLDHSTSDLHTLATANKALLTSLDVFSKGIGADLLTHIGGGSLLGDGSAGRHVASHIDLNDIPSDLRDSTFFWSGLLDKDGNLRSASNVADALSQINASLIMHENTTVNAHPATSIDLDVSEFTTVPKENNTVQKFVKYVDQFDAITVKEHRATQHSNSIPKIARSTNLSLPDGYGWQNIVPPTSCSTFLVRPPNTIPVDDISSGDQLVLFSPDNSNFIFDSQFVNVKFGDIIRINYGNGMETSFPVESIRFQPGVEWIIRLNGVNLADSDGYALARIDRPLADISTAGILAVAAANATPTGSFNSILQSVIVGDPKAAVTVGNGFDPNQLDLNHYKLYLEMYPTGNPSDRVIVMPFIDVTGNEGLTPGHYTLESVIEETNKSLREIGYNFRMMAFAHDGNFAIMMTDSINNVSFSITSGNNSSGTLIEGTFTENVIGDASGDGFDALGLGSNHADVASPAFITSFADSTSALLPTKVIVPRKNRNFIVDGVKSDSFAPTWNANSDGYWDGYISARTTVGSFTVETTYSVELNLKPAGLKPGKTITIQPAIEFSDSLYNDLDYGRFIIKSVNFSNCPGESSLTLITVINGIHALGNGFSASGKPNLPVRIYFSEDSVSFNNQNIIDTTPTAIDYLRLHEIFISNARKTFSHERARMAFQAEATPALSTTNWHIDDVSSKLRGYRDDNTSFNKYVRLYILSYDIDTGEFDGYIGKRSPSGNGITSTGPVVTGRKNIVTRFYDETNIDYIDLIFIDESSTTPGNAVLSDGISGGGGTARYVDIELFDSMQLNDELFLLATAEVNWDPSTGSDVIQRVNNKREFGSIDEEDLSDSLKKYISAGDRYLHENGIIRGFEFDFINPTDNREIFYKGGLGLVNGFIVAANNVSVTIPEVHLETDTPPATIDWAVCLNEFGHLEPIIITSTKSQFFAKDNNGSNTYYLPSVTFTELVENRKDLTPIAVITATIASVTINDSDHLDVRRFIDDGSKRELVFSPKDFAGTFHTVDALKNWVNQYGSSNPLLVKVRGDFDITSSLNLTGFTNKLILEGDGATFNINANRGVLIDNNITIKNITFNYEHLSSLTFVSEDIINVDNGCIYIPEGTSVSDICIDNCVFNSSASGQRPPFIAFSRNRGDIIQNLSITNNYFNDSNSGAEVMAAVAIVSNNLPAAGTEPAIVYNTRITNNHCNRNQGIWLTQFATASTFDIDEPGVVCFDTIIDKNNCGIIGFSTTASESAFALINQIDRGNNLIIKENVTNVIGNYINFADGQAFTGTVLSLSDEQACSSGSVSILHNVTNFITLNNTDDDSSNNLFSQKIIDGNKLTATDYQLLDKFTNTAATGSFQSAVAAINVGHGTLDVSNVLITNNYINQGRYDSINHTYNRGIFCSASATIKGNVIRGLAASGIGITASDDNSGFRQIIISENQIYRGSTSISRYIDLDSNSAEIGGIVVSNYLDSSTIDGSDTQTITQESSRAHTWVVSQNRNHQETVIVRSGGQVAFFLEGSGRATVSGVNPGVTSSHAYVDPASSTFTVGCEYLDLSTVEILQWDIPLFDVLPEGTRLVSVSATFTLNSASVDQADARFIVSNVSGSVNSGDTDVTAGGGGTSATVSYTPTADTYFATNSNGAVLTAQFELEDGATFLAGIGQLSITYSW